MRRQAGQRRLITLERTYRATVQEVWELWTTKEGIDSWWGPDGFRVEVQAIDLRPGGEMTYVMSAVGADQVRFLEEAGMPLRQEAHLTFTEVVLRRRLAYLHRVDFMPGVEPYDVAHIVELEAAEDGVRMRLTFEAMHDDRSTQLAVAGWENELGKLERALAA